MNIFHFKKLLLYKNIIHVISTRECGTIKNEDGSINKKNLESFFDDMSLPLEKAMKMNQVHSGNVAVVEVSEDRTDDIDGLITNKKNIPLYVLTADCLPILLYDPIKEVIGIAHGGRRGLESGIVENMIDKFKSGFGSDPENILSGIGPGIEKKCYEVDGELMDISAMAQNSLINLGVKPENIELSKICTKCNMDKYFSYRGGDEYKRFASTICLI